MEIALNKDNFEKEVLQSEVPVLVDFWAPWCGPCRMVAPIVAEIAEEYAGKLKVCKVNADENPELCMEWKIVSIPALYLYNKGQLANRAIGYMEKDQLESFVSQVL